MSLFNDYNVCKMAFENDEVIMYLKGENQYSEPADRYSDIPEVDIPTRTSCINDYYKEIRKDSIIDKFKKSLISISSMDKKNLQLALKYVMAQLQLEKRNAASFKLDDKIFFDNLRTIIANANINSTLGSVENKELQEMLDIQNNFISNYTGYSIK